MYYFRIFVYCSMRGFRIKVIYTQCIALWLLTLFLYPQPERYRNIIRWFFAFWFILYLPWYRISYMIFTDIDDVGWFERFMMSFAISLAVITFISFYMRYLDMLLYPMHIYVVSLILITLACVYVWLIRKKRSQQIS